MSKMGRPRLYTKEESKARAREVTRKWKLLNPEHVKNYAEKHRAEAVERTRQWRINNPEKAKVTQRNEYLRRKKRLEEESKH